MSPKRRTRKPKSVGKEKRRPTGPLTNPIAELYRRIAPHFAVDLDQTSSLPSERLASNLYAGMHKTTNLGSGFGPAVHAEGYLAALAAVGAGGRKGGHLRPV